MIEVSSLDSRADLWQDVVDIFFNSSSKKSFDSKEEKDHFLYKYLGFYKENFPELFLIALQNNIVLGYICGAQCSKSQTKLYDLLEHYEIFEEYFDFYPAHLHINLTSASRGKGIGSTLIKSFEDLCTGPGIHLITSPQARNRSFYLKNKYTFEIIREYRGLELLFMGKTL